jgi:hypothetical protein
MTTLNTDGPAIDDVYAKLHRLPKQNRKSVLTAHSGSDGAKILRLEMPNLTKEEHLKLAQDHLTQSIAFRREYGEALDDAAMSLWGRPWQITDYKVSGIGRDEFSDEQKNKLRNLNQKSLQHEDVGRAHAHASGLRSTGVENLIMNCELEEAAIHADALPQSDRPRFRG